MLQIVMEMVVMMHMRAHFIIPNSNRAKCGGVHDKQLSISFPTTIEPLRVAYMINIKNQFHFCQ